MSFQLWRHFGYLRSISGGINPYTLKNKHSDGGWKMRGYVKFRSATPLKFNMELENGGLEGVFPFQLGDSYVPC